MIILYSNIDRGAGYMIIQKIKQFMYGRYGGDQLSLAIFALGFLFYIVYVITRLWPFYILSLIIYGIDVYRSLSKNIPKRQSENVKFLQFVWKIKNFRANLKCDFEEMKTYKHFKCPSCGQKIRIPRGRGKVEIHCPKCSNNFIKKV